MSSFDSAKGPSITVRFPAEYWMRQPFELAWSPEASSSTPAFTSSSWYFAIAAMSSSAGIMPASESLLALTIIMNRMANFSFGFGLEPSFRRPLDRLELALYFDVERGAARSTGSVIFLGENVY